VGTGVPREAAAAAPGVRGYSHPPPPVSPIRGLIDFHTHAAPDVFGRAVDDGNPTPADGLQMFVTGLAAEGVSREQIQTMGCQIPGALLMG